MTLVPGSGGIPPMSCFGALASIFISLWSIASARWLHFCHRSVHELRELQLHFVDFYVHFASKKLHIFR